jgi:hypothetical protein
MMIYKIKIQKKSKFNYGLASLISEFLPLRYTRFLLSLITEKQTVLLRFESMLFSSQTFNCLPKFFLTILIDSNYFYILGYFYFSLASSATFSTRKEMNFKIILQVSIIQ